MVSQTRKPAHISTISQAGTKKSSPSGPAFIRLTPLGRISTRQIRGARSMPCMIFAATARVSGDSSALRM